MSDSSLDELSALAEKLSHLEKVEIEREVAALAAPKLEAAIARTLSAGQAPEGVPWAPKKKDGGRAYAGAAEKMQANAYGNLIRVVIHGPEVYGHFGGPGRVPRPMLPDAGSRMPQSVSVALDQAAKEYIDRVFR